MTKWFISDLHLGHENAWKVFKRPDGSPLRDFQSTEEMDDTIINNINEVVHERDTLIMLGDIAIQRRALKQIERIVCRDKRIVKGNHDIFQLKDYLDIGFKEVYGVYVMSEHRLICSHIPLHPDSMDRWKLNLHGHLHYGWVKDKDGNPDPKYRNFSVEMVDYKPVSFEQVMDEL